jgi:hypothetical protein
MNAGKYGRASSALKDLLALDPLNAEARRLFATLHLRLGSLISARTAFESLVREAMERQDYWLAESLLREYLTAGPRCVPFLDMLGHVYEEKGDVMAAVAEYGKAVEVLLEDPDSDHPNRASELFIRIRSLAPGSPVAFRFAAMFDTVTGQMLQAPSPPEVAAQDTQSPDPTRLEEATAGEVPAMPWEQAEPANSEARHDEPVHLPVPDGFSESNEPMGSIVAQASLDTVPGELRQGAISDVTQVMQGPNSSASNVLSSNEISPLPEAVTEPDHVDIRSEATAGDPTDVQCLENTSSSPAAGEVPAVTIEVLTEASIHPISEAPASPVPMPWDQIEEAACAIMPDGDLSVTIQTEIPPSPAVETDHSPLPAVQSASPTIEDDFQVSADPIETTAIPAPMSWAQSEEVTSADPSRDELKIDLETGQSDGSIEAPGADQVFATKPAAEPSLPVTSEMTSSGLSWEEILSAVTAMQASPGHDRTMPSEVSDACHDGNSTEEATAAVAPSLDGSENLSLSTAAPVPDFIGNATDDAPTLSAPMPWEQIEIDDVAILRQEPEPEYGSMPGESIREDHDPTQVMQGIRETDQFAAAAAAAVDATVKDSSLEGDAIPTQQFSILSADGPFESPEQTIHIPPETIESVEEPALGETPEAEPTTLSTIDLSGERPLRLVDAVAIEVEEASESCQVPAEAPAVPVTQEAGLEAGSLDSQAIAADVPVGKDSPAGSQSEADSEVIPIAQEQSASPPQAPDNPSSIEAIVTDPVDPQPTEPAVSLIAPMIRLEPAASEAGSSRPATAPDGGGQGETILASIEKEQVPEPVPDGPSHPVDGSLRILWDDSSSAPTTNASIGNMLTRWLKKPNNASSAAVGYVPAIPDEPAAPIAPLSDDHREATNSVAAGSTEPSDRAKPIAVKGPATRTKPSEPLLGPVLHRISRALIAVLNTGFSTTRSLVISLLTLVGLALVLTAVVIAGMASMWLFLEEQPNSAFHNMTSVPQRTLQDSRKNGYLLLLGFGAAPNHDPIQTGLERKAETTDPVMSRSCLSGKGGAAGSRRGASEEMAGAWWNEADPAARMQIDASDVRKLLSQAEVSMSRYRQWLTMPFEDWGYGQAVSPICGLILHAHRLYVAEGFAQDVETGLTRLETDLEAWRTVFGHAKTLSMKMLANGAMNDDIALLGALLLRPDLDERMVGRLSKLARPLDSAERSIRWPMQSQFLHATTMPERAVRLDGDDAGPFYASIAAWLPMPMQRRFNAYAEYYEAAGKAGAEGRFADLPKQSQFVRTPPRGPIDLFINPIEGLVGIDPLPPWELYAGRVMETDARLRLSSLQAWLRRTPSEPDLLTRIAKAGRSLYDPFTGFPMLVNMKKGVFYSVGQDLKDNDARALFDVVAKIPPAALADAKRTVEPEQIK